MYLTAQRVWRDGASGINAFLHEHRGAEQAGIDWNAPTIAAVDRYPGNLVAQAIEVEPGGNAVLSYLDVLAPDGADSGQIRRLLTLAPAMQERSPVCWRSGSTVARFVLDRSADSRLAPDPELLELGERALALLERLPARTPLTVPRRIGESGFGFELSDESIGRLRARFGDAWHPPRIRVAKETATEWHAAGMPSLGEIVVGILTGLSAEEVRQEGGVKVLTQAGGDRRDAS